MPTTYCSSCGHKMTYTLTKPKFCSECGQSLQTFEKSTAEPQIKNKAPEITIDDPDGSDIFEVPRLDSLAYEIEYDQDTSFKLGDIMPKQEEKVKKRRGRPRKKS